MYEAIEFILPLCGLAEWCLRCFIVGDELQRGPTLIENMLQNFVFCDMAD